MIWTVRDERHVRADKNPFYCLRGTKVALDIIPLVVTCRHWFRQTKHQKPSISLSWPGPLRLSFLSGNSINIKSEVYLRHLNET